MQGEICNDGAKCCIDAHDVGHFTMWAVVCLEVDSAGWMIMVFCFVLKNAGWDEQC